MVDVTFVEKLDALVSLQALKDDAALDGMRVTQKGSRLSVQPVTAAEWKEVCRMGGLKLKKLKG